MAVEVIDPNSVNINENMTNSIPQYQDMHIYAELTAVARPRTTIQSTGLGFANVDIKSENGGGAVINFLGSQQDDSFNKANFTTDYYDGSVGGNIQYEGFGITSIKATINSSYIPQVDIQFTDIRGLTFFNQENSKYRMIFDFPPPIFQLTLKGYYGGALTYQLHLVKYTSEFKSENGNFVIDAQFVAMTFAPLADILFKYILNFQMMGDNPKKLTENKEKASCTFDFIRKLRALYSERGSPSTNSIEAGNVTKNQVAINKINDIIIVLNDCIGDKSDVDLNKNLQKFGKVFMHDYISYYDNKEFKILDNISNFDKNLTSNNQAHRLLISFGSTLIPKPDPSLPATVNTGESPIPNVTKEDNKFTALAKYREGLLALVGKGHNINDSDIPAPKYFYYTGNTTIGKYNEEYVVLDISVFYQKLYSARVELSASGLVEQDKLNEKMNTFVSEKLGMRPTVYEIMKLICDDIDFFFKTLRGVSQGAEKEHSDKLAQISNFSGFKESDVVNGTTIFAFPLLIDGNQKRIGPNEINKELNGIFTSELILIKNFIESFKADAQVKANEGMKEDTNADGNRKWIPYSPLDSDITGAAGPYISLTNLNDMLSVTLKRFYKISQFANFIKYRKTQLENVKLYADAEAANFVSSLNSINSSSVVWRMFNSGEKNTFQRPANMYAHFTAYLSDLYDLKIDGVNDDYLEIDGVYVDKNSNNYNGLQILPYNAEFMTTRTKSADANDPVQKYFDAFDKKYTLLFGLKSKLKKSEIITTTRNMIGIKISEGAKSENVSDFLNNRYSGDDSTNTTFDRIWSHDLNDTNSKIQTNPINITTKSIIYLSNFGRTYTPFTDNLNINMFGFPSIIEMPKYFIGYVGSLISLHNSGPVIIEDTMKELELILSNDIIDRIKIDLVNIDKYLSISDKIPFLTIYDDFMNSSGGIGMFITLDNWIKDAYDKNSGAGVKGYEEYFKAHPEIFTDLLTLHIMLNYSDITFSMWTGEYGNHKKYESLKTSNGTGNSINDTFFQAFIDGVKERISAKAVDEKAKKAAFDKIAGDQDIINETYYSFKNINDKWIAGLDCGIGGYPYVDGPLIDSFRFVNRAMGDIGQQVILNPEHLIQMADDPNVSIYTVISSLLSLNGFEFFPLQNFMDFNTSDGKDGENKSERNLWQNSFKIDNTEIIKSPQRFVCMYIGGSSSYLTGVESQGVYQNQFKNDNITNLMEEGLTDFDNSTDVRAFSVKFGEQNQSMFTDMKIDSKEYPETNESIQILARLAGDQGQNPPIPKGQNLFNLYENRSYKATISGLGNVMIQPTQYFQLENVPMYNGAYVILGVEHNVVPNNMKTSFYGTKVNRFPVPFVSEASSITNFYGATTQTSFAQNVVGGNFNNPHPLAGTSLANTPLPIGTFKISSLFNLDEKRGRLHEGIDMDAAKGTPVWATGDGIVREASFQPEGFTAYGNIVLVDHENTVFTLYAHLSSISISVGNRVTSGIMIGHVGDTGINKDDSIRSSGMHLHYEVRVGNNGKKGAEVKDPYVYLKKETAVPNLKSHVNTSLLNTRPKEPDYF